MPPQQDFKHEVKAKAYKTAERNGLVWAFMGDQNSVPELPMVESALMPEEQLDIGFAMRECNFLRGVEGELDNSHVGIMHFGSVGTEVFNEGDYQRYLPTNRVPEYKLQVTHYGYMYAGRRPAIGAKFITASANSCFHFGPCRRSIRSRPMCSPASKSRSTIKTR